MTTDHAVWPKVQTRTLHVGDVHEQFYALKGLVEKNRSRFDDVVVLHGDVTTLDKTSVGWLQSVAEEFGCLVAFLDGNHEDFDWLLAQPVSEDGLRWLDHDVVHLPRGFRWEWLGTTFMAAGGAASINRSSLTPGDDWFWQETITAAEAEAMCAGGKVDVLLTHDRPAGYSHVFDNSSWPEADVRACEAHADLLRGVVTAVEADLVVTGHLHMDYTETQVDGEGREYLVVTLDLAARDGAVVLDVAGHALVDALPW